jgi:EmrB/QacA subfamily drug resistance transporter
VPRIPLFVVAIALANFLVPLNSTMIVVALPTIARDLAVDRATVSWLVTAYLIAMAALQPIGGRIGDRFGPRRVLLMALIGFALASAAAPLARDLATLVAFRLLQALCAAAVTPNAMGLLRGGAVEGRAGTYFGLTGAVSGIGATAGPLAGGLLASFDWRWIFAANVPLVATILALGWSTLPRTPGKRTAPPDVVGAISLGLLLSVAAWTLTAAEHNAAPVTVALALAVLVGGALFLRYESRQPDAALPPALFGVRAFSGANATIALSNLALYGTFLALPIALEGPGSEVRSGIVLTAMSVGMIVLSPVAGALVDRYDARVPTVIGGALIAVGLLIPVVLERPADPALLLVAMPIAGAGVALTFPSTRIAALDAAPARFAGLASGVTSTSRYIGGIVGALVAGLTLGRASDLSALPAVFITFALAGIAAGVVGGTTLHAVRGRIDVRGDEAGAAD